MKKHPSSHVATRVARNVFVVVSTSLLVGLVGCGKKASQDGDAPPSALQGVAALRARPAAGRRCDPDHNPDCPPVPRPTPRPRPRPTATVDCVTREGDYAWSCRGPLDGYRCISVNEGSDPHTWSDNYFCSKDDTAFEWSMAGPIEGKVCLAITEPSEPAGHTWTDNFLCVQKSPRYRYYWSVAGPLEGKQCLRWWEPSDPHTWSDNYLCFDQRFFDGDTNPTPGVGPID
jgi:hypothetical protein